jgi:hypothetical protein
VGGLELTAEQKTRQSLHEAIKLAIFKSLLEA